MTCTYLLLKFIFIYLGGASLVIGASEGKYSGRVSGGEHRCGGLEPGSRCSIAKACTQPTLSGLGITAAKV